MKLRNTNLTFLFSVLALSGCAKKVYMECGTAALMSQPGLESKVLSLHTIGTADTTVAFISGFVLGKDSAEKFFRIDTLPYACVLFINRETSDSSGLYTSLEGRFQHHLTAGTYDILFSNVGYNKLKVEKVKFAPGELKEMNILLGHGYGRSVDVNGENLNSTDQR